MFFDLESVLIRDSTIIILLISSIKFENSLKI